MLRQACFLPKHMLNVLKNAMLYEKIRNKFFIFSQASFHVFSLSIKTDHECNKIDFNHLSLAVWAQVLHLKYLYSCFYLELEFN